MIAKVISFAFLSFFMLSSAFLFMIAVLIWSLTVWWDTRLLWLHRFTSLWANLYLWVMPAWESRVEGRKKLIDSPCIMVSNHQSLLDILVVFCLYFPFKFVSKAEIFKVPFIGWNMKLNGYIGIQRGNKDSAHKMLADCKAALKKGSSVYLFPEGTRSASGLVGPFKPGAFVLAHELQLPIQLLVINGSKDALPKKSWDFHGHHQLSITVLERLDYPSFAHLSIEDTAEMVRQKIIQHVKEHQEAVPTQSSGQPQA